MHGAYRIGHCTPQSGSLHGGSIIACHAGMWDRSWDGTTGAGIQRTSKVAWWITDIGGSLTTGNSDAASR